MPVQSPGTHGATFGVGERHGIAGKQQDRDRPRVGKGPGERSRVLIHHQVTSRQVGGTSVLLQRRPALRDDGDLEVPAIGSADLPDAAPVHLRRRARSASSSRPLWVPINRADGSELSDQPWR